MGTFIKESDLARFSMKQKQQRGFQGNRRSISKTVNEISELERLRDDISNSKLLNREVKQYCCANRSLLQKSTTWENSFLIQNPAATSTLLIPTQGTSNRQRIGNVIVLHRVRLQGSIQLPRDAVTVSTIPSYELHRMVLFLDRRSNGGPPLAGEFPLNTYTDTVAPFYAFRNWNTRNRFEIVLDQYFEWSNQEYHQVTSAPQQQIACGRIQGFEYQRDFNDGRILRFTGNAGTLGDIIENAVSLMVNALVAEESYYFNYNFDAYWSDVQ